MAKICPCKKLSTKGKPTPKSKATVIQPQQQKNKQSLEKKAVNKQHASEVGAQNASPSATIIEPTSAQLKRRSIELEKCEREITVLDKPCKKDNNYNNNNTAGRKKKKRARKAGKDKAKQAAPTHQTQPSSSPPLRPSSDIHATIPEAEATTTAAPAVQAVVSIECTPSTPSVASESIQPASSINNIPQPHQHEVNTQSVEEASVQVKEEEEEDEELKSLMQMSLDDWLSIFDPILEESYRQTEIIIKSSHERGIHTLSMEAALQRQHPDETARIIASMRVQHEQELEQRYADHCKRTADDKEAIHVAHREDMALAAQRQERMERERNERERASKERERIKRAAEEDAWRRRVEADRRESDRQFARMVEDGNRLALMCRIAPLIRTRLVKHFADAG